MLKMKVFDITNDMFDVIIYTIKTNAYIIN